MDLAKELDAMLSQMDQRNAKIYKIPKPRYTLNDFWTNLDHGNPNLDITKKADLTKVVMDRLSEFGVFWFWEVPLSIILGQTQFVGTIQKFFFIWIPIFLKKGASDNTISYFDQFFRFIGLRLILASDLGRSGQNKSSVTENR